MEFGAPSYNTTRTRTNYIKITNEQPVIVKILPPLGSMASTGRWWVKAALHYTEPDSNKRIHVYSCAEEWQNKRLVVACPACTKYEAIKAEYESKKQAGIDSSLLAPLVEAMKRYRVDRSYYLNVMDRNGITGLLKIKHNAKEQLDQHIKSLRDQGVDPIEQGVFFEFSRTGVTFQETKYHVKPYMERVIHDGNNFWDLKRDPLNELQKSQISGAAFGGRDLGSIGNKLSLEEVTLLVNGDITTIERIFAASKNATSTDSSQLNLTPPSCTGTGCDTCVNKNDTTSCGCAATTTVAQASTFVPNLKTTGTPVVTATPSRLTVASAPVTETAKPTLDDVKKTMNISDADLLKLFKQSGLE